MKTITPDLVAFCCRDHIDSALFWQLHGDQLAALQAATIARGLCNMMLCLELSFYDHERFNALAEEASRCLERYLPWTWERRRWLFDVDEFERIADVEAPTQTDSHMAFIRLIKATS